MICLPSFGSAQATNTVATRTHVVFAGSGSNLAITRTLARAFMSSHPGIRIEILSSIGSKGGVRAVADRSIDVGLVSRGMNADEREWGLILRPYARTAVVLGVHPSVADRAVMTNDVLAIFSGSRSRWRNDQEIIVFVREPGDSSIGVLINGIDGFEDVYYDSWRKRRWTPLFTDQKMNRQLAGTPNAIGITDIGSITAGKWGIAPLAINGVSPSTENISNRSYPLTKTLAFVYSEKRLSPVAGRFMDFVRSAAGSEILQRNGYVAIE